MKVLSGHTSPETAYLVDDYPYGFRLRCKIRYWIETNKNGSRVVSQTTNPKRPGEVWNKPKASTYSDLRVLYLDENNYVQNAALTTWNDTPTIDAFVDVYGEALTSDRDKNTLNFLRMLAQRQDEARAKRLVAKGGVL